MESSVANSVSGSARLEPINDVVAGSFGTWTLVYTAGKYGIDENGALLIARRMASDWGIPQFDRPSDPDYTTVACSGGAKVRGWYDSSAYVRPWRTAVVIRVSDGVVAPGEEITVTFGDRSGGGPGSQAQSFPESRHEFHVAVDCFATGHYVELSNQPTVRVIGGSASRLRLLAPSQAVADEPFCVIVKVEDRWGNPSYDYDGFIEIAVPEDEGQSCARHHYDPDEHGVHRFPGIILREGGVHRLVARDASRGLITESNPIVVSKIAEPLKLFWGDLHGQTEATLGTGTVDEYFRYGRDTAALDFLSHCANDFQITNEHYSETQEAVKRYHKPGKFVTFLGYEWSANTPAGGDHNVYFLEDDQPIHRSSHWQVPDHADEETDRYPITALHGEFRGREDVMIVPHVGGRAANLSFHDSSFAPIVEIQGVQGLHYWFADEALQRGLRVGFTAGSDDHTGRPGSTFPTLSSHARRIRGGLIAIYATELTRKALWEAIKKRHCYGTTGERIIVSVYADGHPMGEEYPSSGYPHISVRILGTAPLDRVELYRGLEPIYRAPIHRIDGGKRLQIIWSGAHDKGRRKATIWDGGLTLAGGTILAATEFAPGNPMKGIDEVTPHAVQWHSYTCGNWDGIYLKVDAMADAVLVFKTGICEFSMALGELNHGAKVVSAGGVAQQVEIAWVPDTDGPTSLDFDYVDEEIRPGVNPYHVRIRQVDGAAAWSSPIFVEK